MQDRVEIIANDQGNRTTPSFVAFTDSERLIGDSAKNQVAINATNTVFDAKRMIGRKFSDPSVQQDMKHFSFKVVQKEGDKPVVEVQYKGETKQFSPEEIDQRHGPFQDARGCRVVPRQGGEDGRRDGAGLF